MHVMYNINIYCMYSILMYVISYNIFLCPSFFFCASFGAVFYIMVVVFSYKNEIPWGFLLSIFHTTILHRRLIFQLKENQNFFHFHQGRIQLLNFSYYGHGHTNDSWVYRFFFFEIIRSCTVCTILNKTKLNFMLHGM